MGDLLKAIKLIPKTILDWHEKQLEEERLLVKCDKVIDSFNELKQQAENRDDEIREIRKDLKELRDDVAKISTTVDSLKQAERNELSASIHQYYIKGMKQGWLSAEDKENLQEVFSIYSKALNGNGVGEFHYKAAIALPESEEEMKKKNV